MLDNNKIYEYNINAANIMRIRRMIMADMGSKEAAILWGVSQKQVQRWLRKQHDPRITQDKKGSPYHIPKDYPNPFKK